MTKIPVPNGTQADAYCVLARQPESERPFDPVLLLVLRGLNGVEVGPAFRAMGHRSADIAERVSETPAWQFLVVDDEGRPAGVLRREDLRVAMMHARRRLP